MTDPDSYFFNRGRLNVAFVFSAPGRYEIKEGKPVARATGTNLNHALRALHKHLPSVFESTDRYEYRITNAYKEPLWAAKDGRSEASAKEVRRNEEVERVIRNLKSCNLVILCGANAQLLKERIGLPGRTILSMPHTSVQSLVSSYSYPKGTGCQVRAEDWAMKLLTKWKAAKASV